MLNSCAFTKVQSIVLISIIVIAAVGVGAVYVLLSGEGQSAETIKIGICGDLDMAIGKKTLEGAILASEQINDEGGILGRKIEVIGEDSDYETAADINTGVQALTRLITYHNVDFIICSDGDRAIGAYQDIIAEHKKIFFAQTNLLEEWTQRVLDEYDKYKYFFRTIGNMTSAFIYHQDACVMLRELTGFNKIAMLGLDVPSVVALMEGAASILQESHGFEVVYLGKYPSNTVDFSSYFAAAEAAGAEIMNPNAVYQAGIPLVKEWYDRQSPMVFFGMDSALQIGGWEKTDGKCEDATIIANPVTSGYPLTSQTLPLRDAFVKRWGELPDGTAATSYDTIRYILYDAIIRAGTIETEAVIAALEETSIETSNARNFVFTSSHDTMFGQNPNDPEEDYLFGMMFQWQDGEMVPVYPKKIMEEAGATYTFPDWSGPWD